MRVQCIKKFINRLGGPGLMSPYQSSCQFVLQTILFNRLARSALSIEIRRAQLSGIWDSFSRKAGMIQCTFFRGSILDSIDLPLDGDRLAPANITARNVCRGSYAVTQLNLLSTVCRFVCWNKNRKTVTLLRFLFGGK